MDTTTTDTTDTDTTDTTTITATTTDTTTTTSVAVHTSLESDLKLDSLWASLKSAMTSLDRDSIVKAEKYKIKASVACPGMH